LFGATGTKYLFRCPVCDACKSETVDVPCSAYCAGVAKKSVRTRGGGSR